MTNDSNVPFRRSHADGRRLSFSPQSDFLDFYVSYLKELPDCLSVVNMLASSSVTSSVLLEVK